MTTVSPKKGHDPARVNEISEKLMENPELASLISELSTSADDASDLVKGRGCPILCVRGLGLQVVRESVGVCHG